MDKEKKYYVYVHRYASGPKQGEVFYVGKGSGNRVKSKVSRSYKWKSIVNKYGFDYNIIAEMADEKCAFSIERALIRFYGRSNLCNRSDGGDGGMSGYVFNRETVRLKAEKCYKPVVNSSGQVFQSLKHAAEFCRSNGYPNATEAHISSCCNGKRWVAFGFSWSFDIESVPELIDSSLKVNEMRLKGVICSNGKSFNSVSEASKWVNNELGIKCGTSDISRCCNGKRKTCGGLTWMYNRV